MKTPLLPILVIAPVVAFGLVNAVRADDVSIDPSALLVSAKVRPEVAGGSIATSHGVKALGGADSGSPFLAARPAHRDVRLAGTNKPAQ